MRLATWNVNSVRARLERLVAWLRANEPDVVLLQETKVEDALFPRQPLEDLGYEVIAFGQKAYNGVAILSRLPVGDVVRGMPGEAPEDHKRVLACRVGESPGVVVVDVYAPNGHAVGNPRYHEKLRWYARLREMLDAGFDPAEHVVVAGDFNLTFDDRDVYDPAAWRERIHCSAPERQALAHVMEFGLLDGLRKLHEGGGIYTWWDQRWPSLQRNQGLRIDHLLLSHSAYAALQAVHVDVDERAKKGCSDHAPVLGTFDWPSRR